MRLKFDIIILAMVMLTLDQPITFKIKNIETNGNSIEKIVLTITSEDKLQIIFDDETYAFDCKIKKNVVQIRTYEVEPKSKNIIDKKCELKNCEKISDILKINSQVRAMLMFQNNKLLNMSSIYVKDKDAEEWERFTLEMIEKSTQISQEI